MNAAAPQDEVNRAVYYSPGVYRRYLSNVLYPAEAACLLRHQSSIAGRDVLDVGAGAGRLARYLAPLAAHYEGIDYSPVMVDYLRTSMPALSVHLVDFRNLKIFAADSFDFVIASDNVIDALTPEDRSRALAETRRVLRIGGRAAFSSHNLRYRRAFPVRALTGRRTPSNSASTARSICADAGIICASRPCVKSRPTTRFSTIPATSTPACTTTPRVPPSAHNSRTLVCA